MTNPEVAAANTDAKTKDDTSTSVSEAGGSAFLERVSDIPVVNVAKEYGTAAYNNVKQYNKFTQYALSTAESTALFFALMAKPYLQKIEPQAKMVDHIACRGLDAVEEKAPILLKSPEEMVVEARKLISSSVETGYQKVDEIKTMGADAVSAVKSYGLQKASDALANTENIVDKYLPPPFGEESENASDESTSLAERANYLKNKVTQRMYGHGVKQIFNMHRLSQESITKLAYTIEMLQHIKENYTSKSVQEYIDEAKVKATWIWEELSKEPSDAAEDDKRLEQRMLSLARRMTSVVINVYSSKSFPLASLPKTCADGVHAANTYAAELFTQLDQAVKAGEASSSLLQLARDKITALESVVRSLIDQSQPAIEMEELSANSDETKKDCGESDQK